MDRDRRQTSTRCCWLENVLRVIAGRGRSDNRIRDAGKVWWIVGRKLGNCQSGSIVWWHVTSGNGIAELENRPLKLRITGGKDAADEEKLNGAGGGGPPRGDHREGRIRGGAADRQVDLLRSKRLPMSPRRKGRAHLRPVDHCEAGVQQWQMQSEQVSQRITLSLLVF